MHARSALFDVYGDLLRQRGGQAPVAALVRLLEPIGIAAPAVRTAVSRMVLQEWLEPVTLPSGRGYRATEQAIRRLDEARERIYRTSERRWDGRWHLLLVDRVRDRSVRSRLQADLSWMGYAALDERVWLSPWEHPALPGLLARTGVRGTTAVAVDVDPPVDPEACWGLATLGADYARWLDTVRGDDTGDRAEDADRADFARRFHLVHEWRKFLFRDPGLPDELLPDQWPGREAAAHFASEANRLQPGADRFVDRCLGSAGTHRPKG